MIILRRPTPPLRGAELRAAESEMVRNRILEALPGNERAAVWGIGKEVDLPRATTLSAPDEKLDNLYFPGTAVFSLITDSPGANSVECGNIGAEGFLGLPVFLGADSCPQRVMVQIPGKACQVPADKFREVIQTLPELRKLLNRYSLAYMAQVSQTVACNSQHTVIQRAARWMILAHDRVGGRDILITQEYLAFMLGVRRPSVTTAQAILKKRGLIDYTRGRLQILDLKGLEAVACHCHKVVRREMAKLTAGGTSLAS